jgi:hypothetical protein
MERISIETKPASRVLSVDIYLNCDRIVSMFDVKLKYEKHLDCYRVIKPSWENDMHTNVIRFEKKHISDIKKHYSEKNNVLFTRIEIQIYGKIQKEEVENGKYSID